MSDYVSVKLLDDKIKNLISTLKKRGIEPRSKAEAVNILIDNFLLNKFNHNSKQNRLETATEESS